MRNKFNIFLFIIVALFGAQTARAVCPVCTITATAGVGLCRWLGIDDIISGIWVGGLLVSSSLWLMGWLVKKSSAWKKMGWLVFAFFYATVIVPLYFTEIIGHPYNKLWGVDKLLLGIVVGTIVFALSVWLHQGLKKKNNGHSYFPLQKATIPIFSLIAVSLIFYLITKCQ